MDRFEDLQQKIEKMHRRIVRVLAESDRLDPHVREIVRGLAEEALELTSGLQKLRTEAERKSLAGRVFKFLFRAIPIVGKLVDED